MFGFIVKWVGLFFIIPFIYNCCVEVTKATGLPVGFMIWNITVTYSFLVSAFFLYIGFKLNVS